MTVQDIIDRFSEIENKNLEVEMVNPYREAGKPIPIDNIFIMKRDDTIYFDFETYNQIDL